QAKTSDRRTIEMPHSLPDISVPTIGLSLRTLVDLVTTTFGSRTIVIAGDFDQVMSVGGLRRVGGVVRFSDRDSVLSVDARWEGEADELVMDTARAIMAELEPMAVAWFVRESDASYAALLVREFLGRTGLNDAQRAYAHNVLGAILSEQGQEV